MGKRDSAIAEAAPDPRVALLAELKRLVELLSLEHLQDLVRRLGGEVDARPRRDLLPRLTSKASANARQLHKLAMEQLDFANRVEGTSPTAATSARAKFNAIERELHRVLAEQHVQSVKDPVKRLELRERMAAEEGSFVAAQQFAKARLELQEKVDAEKRAKLAQRLSGLSEDELVAKIVAALPGMSPASRARIIDAAKTGKG
jgi:DNA-directed RNA polymerase subunit F